MPEAASTAADDSKTDSGDKPAAKPSCTAGAKTKIVGKIASHDARASR